MVELSAGSLLLAFLITVIEMTEVVALVVALHGEDGSIRHGALGAVAGTALVGGIALVGGAFLLRVPAWMLLIGSAFALYAFGLFLFRSTRRAYHRLWHPAPAHPEGAGARLVQFGGGFTVGTVESVEAVIVLVSIAAAGEAPSAIVGALAGGVVLALAALALHGQIRRIKLPWLKLGATALLFGFAVFWTGEAAGVNWPGADLFVAPLFVIALVLVRAAIGFLESPGRLRVKTNS